MKKLLAMLCAAMLCACCVALAACGGSSGSASASASGSGDASASASASAESESAESAADPAQNFIGTWKLAGMKAQGLTIVGDLSGIAGSDISMDLTINEDGTGSMVFGDEPANFTWVQKADDTITATFEKQDTEASSSSESAEAAESDEAAESEAEENIESQLNEPVDLTLADGVLSMVMDMDGEQAELLFTADGKLPGAKEISTQGATPITSEADLIGSWQMTGMNMMGMSAYGEGEALAAMSGGEDISLTFEEGGKGTMSGEEITYKVDENGAVLESGGIELPIQKVDDGIVLDMGSVMGIELIALYTK